MGSGAEYLDLVEGDSCIWNPYTNPWKCEGPEKYETREVNPTRRTTGWDYFKVCSGGDPSEDSTEVRLINSGGSTKTSKNSGVFVTRVP